MKASGARSRVRGSQPSVSRVVGLSCVLCLGLAPAAHGQEASHVEQEERPAAEDARTARARELFKRGLALSKQERWSEAADAFSVAYTLVQRPNLAFNHASVLYRLGRHVAASEALERYRALAAQDNPNRAAALRLGELIERAIVTLELELEPPDAQIEIDGVAVPGRGSPRALRLDPGVRKLVASHPGFERGVTELRLTSGARAQHRIALLPQPQASALSATATAPPLHARAPHPGPARATTASAPRDDADDSLLEEPLFWLGVGAVLGAGIATWQLVDGDTRAEPARTNTGVRIPVN